MKAELRRQPHDGSCAWLPIGHPIAVTIKRLSIWIAAVLGATIVGLGLPLTSAQAQVTFASTQPNVDSFPVVRIGVRISESGGPATSLTPSNFAVLEDGTPVTNAELDGCMGSPNAAIAFVIDTSISMDASLGSGPNSNRSFDWINNGFSQFLKNIPWIGPGNPGSDLAIIPFADSSEYSYPGSPYPGSPVNFFNSSVTADTMSFKSVIANLTYDGRLTNVEGGIVHGAQIVAKSPLLHKVVILITDDAIASEDSMITFLRSQGVELYVMEVARDIKTPFYGNQYVAFETGGDYFSATDTTLYAPVMAAMAQEIFSEHCVLRYVSTLPCPWLASHKVDVTLQYKAAQIATQGSYALGKSTHDTIAPVFTIDSSMNGSRVTTASDPYPCQSGIRSLIDSGSSNFYRVKLPTIEGSLAKDSLIVVDTMKPADDYYLSRDSAGNLSRIHVHYEPKPDTIAPQFGTAQGTPAAYTVVIQEAKPWDRGIGSVSLTGSSRNLQLDGVQYVGHNYATATLHIPNPIDSASGCVTATDSVGNTSEYCFTWFGVMGDNTPPDFYQDPLPEPLTTLSGVGTELGTNDKGIFQTVVTPLYNTSILGVTYFDAQHVAVSVTLGDSLFDAAAAVYIVDSSGNSRRDTLWYKTQIDTAAPEYSIANTNVGSYTISATETRAWDRGIRSITLLPTSQNVTGTTPFFTDNRHGSIALTALDPTLDATMIAAIDDSAGHETIATISYAGTGTIQTQPSPDTVIDFGTVIPPVTVQRKAGISNVNDVSIVVSIAPPTGDDSVFSVNAANQFPIGAHNTEILTFTFAPKWLGNWKAVYPLMNGANRFSTITLIGQSIGQINLSADTILVGKPGDDDTLLLSLDAEPKPVNLDTIEFTLMWNPDVATFGDFLGCPNGSADTGICNYDVEWLSGVQGNRTAWMVRHSITTPTVLSYSDAVLRIPFKTFLAKADSTTVHIVNAHSRLAPNVLTHDGLIRIQNVCGTALIREGMNGTLAARIIAVYPMPASTDFTVKIHSEQDMPATLEVVNLDGSIVKSFSVDLKAGDQETVIPNDFASGAYVLQLRAGSERLSYKVVSIRK